MGYTASGSGEITLKKGITAEFMKDYLNKLEADNKIDHTIEYDCDEYKGQTIIDVRQYDDHYHAEDIETFLDDLIPYISEGALYYMSTDDNAQWRYNFDPETEKWNEESGVIDYNFESYNDDEIINELRKRGYLVIRSTTWKTIEDIMHNTNQKDN